MRESSIKTPSPVHKILTHTLPHVEEYYCRYLLEKFGEEFFPGVSTARFTVMHRSDVEKKTFEQWLAEGILLIGVGGGPFDEHPINGTERKHGECAASLLAAYLGVDTHPAVKYMLKFITPNDTEATPSQLATVINLINRDHPTEPEHVYAWAGVAFDALHNERDRLYSIGKTAFELATVERINGPKGSKLKMVTGVCDDPTFVKFARYKRCDIIIVKSGSGHVKIFVNKELGLKLEDLVSVIRFEEQDAKRKIVTSKFQDLVKEGVVPGAEEWYYHVKGQMLLNGSLTATDVPPTSLDLDAIKAIVKLAFDQARFEINRQSECRKGNCTANPQNPCVWYDWGLSRCRGIRGKMITAGERRAPAYRPTARK